MKALDSGNFFQKSRRMEMDLKDNVDLLFLLCRNQFHYLQHSRKACRNFSFQIGFDIRKEKKNAIYFNFKKWPSLTEIEKECKNLYEIFTTN